MKNKDFYDFGEQIQKIVQSAIDSNDFRELNETVRQTVGEAVEAVRSGVSQASDSMAKARQAGSGKRTEDPRSISLLRKPRHPIKRGRRPRTNILWPIRRERLAAHF